MNTAAYYGAAAGSACIEAAGEKKKRRTGAYRWDARLKLALLTAVVVLNVGVADVRLSGFLLGLGICLGIYSRIPLRAALLFFLAPLWATGLVVMGFSAGFGTTPVAVLGPVTFYREGISLGLSAAARVGCDVAWLAVVFLTSTFTDMLDALRWFRMPSVLVDVLSLSYRYAALLLGEFSRMREAARTRGGFRTYTDRCKSTALILNQIILRAYDRSQRIQQSMRSRGEAGEHGAPPPAPGRGPCPNRCDITPDYSDFEGPVLACEDVSFRHGSHRCLGRLSLTLNRGDAVVLCGPNGAGKTTLLRLIAGLLVPDTGEIRICGTRVDSRSRNQLFTHVGFLAQDPNDQLFCTHVREDVSYGPANMGLAPDDIRHRVDTAMELMEVSHLADRPIHSLSHGEMKRVGLAGLIAMQTPLILLDEPTASLDPASANHLVTLIKHLNSHHGYTIMMVTHDIDLAARIARRVVIVNGGTLVADGPVGTILSDQALLENSRLQPPILTRLFQRLMPAGCGRNAPLTIEEAVEAIQKGNWIQPTAGRLTRMADCRKQEGDIPSGRVKEIRWR